MHKRKIIVIFCACFVVLVNQDILLIANEINKK